MFALISAVISIALTIIDNVAGTSPILGAVYSLVVLLPGLGVSIRRLHDTDRSGWWLLIALVPFVGVIILIVFLASEGKPHENSHGPNPKLVPAH